MNYTPVCGDVFLCDSPRFSATMVKFLMQSPTVWQQVWRYMFNTLQPVRYYHGGLVIGDQIIEQQGVVQYGITDKILSRKITIYRKKSLTNQQRIDLI